MFGDILGTLGKFDENLENHRAFWKNVGKLGEFWQNLEKFGEV